MGEKLRANSRRGGVAAAGAVILSMSGVVPAWAVNPWDLWHRTVPASACAPLDSAYAAKVRLQNGAWRFDGVNTGTVAFYCPIPINAWPADDAQPNYTNMQFYRVWYRDSDGMTTNAKVTVSLRYRNLDGSWNAAGGTLNSNVFADVAFTTKIFNAPHVFETDALYSFYVTIYRANAQEVVEFHGIDFRDGSGPQG
jgi:hypothetical protein